MRTIRSWWLAGCVLAGTTLAATVPALANVDAVLVGRAALVEQDVRTRSPGNDVKIIKVDDTIAFQQQILTGANSRALIEFRDGSTLEAGPNSAITIDRFVFDPEAGTREKTITISRGVFRLATGLAVSNSNTQIRTPLATIGIRGSVVSGIVPSAPGQPNLFFGGSGNFDARNSGGSTQFTAGQSIAVTGPTAPPTSPDRLPVEVTAELIKAINQTLGATPPSTSAPSDNTRTALARANNQPASQQQQAQQGSGNPPPPTTTGGNTVSLPGNLNAAARSGLLNGTTPGNAEQQRVLTTLRTSNPNAENTVRSTTQQQQQLNQETASRGVQQVVTGLAQVTSANRLATLTSTIVQNNPQAAQAAAGVLVNAAIQTKDANLAAQMVTNLAGSNPALAAQLAVQIVQAAENLVGTDPAAALRLAAAAVQIVGGTTVPPTAPVNTLVTLTTAARIMVAPSVMRTNPEAAGALSVQVANGVSNPLVYAANPNAALGAMNNAFLTSTNSVVTAASPGSSSQVVQTLTGAAGNQQLEQTNSSNPQQITEILAQPTLTNDTRPVRDGDENSRFQGSPT